MKKQLLCVAAFLFVLSLQAQVGIGTKTPSKSAELTITSNDKGLLIPSIPLKTTNDTSTISNGNVESLLVYANKKQGDIEPGFYYWNKTKWLKLTVGEDVKDIVINNFEEIVKNETVQNILKTAGGNVFYDGNKFEYLDRSGARKELFFSTVVKANETVTTLVAGADGTYTYKSEDGTETKIDIPASVANNFETIVKNNPETVEKVIKEVLKDVEGNVIYNGKDLVYKDKDGNDQTIDLDKLVKANETVTTLLAGADGTYTYKSEDGTETKIDIPASVVQNFETIVKNNPETVEKVIKEVLKDVEGNVIYNGKDLVYKDKDGNDQTIDLDKLVKANETVTTLLAGADGTYTYKSEDGTEAKIDIPASVVQNFETIVKNNPETVEKVIKEVLKDVEGNVIYNGKDLVYKDKDGNDQTIDLDKLVKANETVTTLLAGADGTYIYKSEDGTETKIDISASVVQNFETIVKNNLETVEKVIKEVLKDVEGNVIYNGKDLVYKDKDGNDQTIDLDKLVKANETVTTLVVGADGTYTYKSEDGTETKIDIPASVANNFETIVKNNPETVEKVIKEVLKDVEGNVIYNGKDLVYKDKDGNDQTIDLDKLVKANETVTTLVAGADGTYTYKSEDGTETKIDIPASVVQNFETIVKNNPETVEKVIKEVLKDVEGNVIYNGKDLVYKDKDGNDQTIDLDKLVKANETVTTLVAGADGTYTYKSEDGTETKIDIPASVVQNFETIVKNNPETVEKVIKEVLKDVEGNVIYNGKDLVYKDKDGNDQTIDLDKLVKANETVTTLLAGADGTYTYKSEDGTETKIDIPASVANNFETIVKNNPETVEKVIKEVLKDVEGNVIYNGKDLVYKDKDGNDQTIDLDKLVKANETVTTLVAGADGTYTYKSEDGTETKIDIPASVVQNFETIVKNNPETVEKVIKEVLKDVEGNVIYNGKDLVYKDKDGNDQTIDLDKLVKANETVTTLVAGADGTYTYKSEDGTETKIDIPASVVQNFETIVKNNPETVEKVIKEVLKDVEGNVIYNGKDLVYKDKDGNDQTIDLDKLVKANETVTTLLAGADGTYTYKSEDGTETKIDIPASVVQNFETIVKNNPETVEKVIKEVLKDVEGNVIYNGKDLVYKDKDGNDQTIDLDKLVKANETVTTLVAGADGTYTYKSEDGTETKIDIPASVVQNFETIVKNNPETVEKVIKEVLKDVEGNVIYNGKDLVYKDKDGNDQTIDLDKLVKANETVTTLVAGADGTYTYKSEDGTETKIDIPASVVQNFETIVKNNPETVEKVIKEVLKDVEGNVIYNGKDLVYKDKDGNDQTIDLDKLVKANETVTTLLAGADGTYTYKSEDGTETKIDIPASVVQNFETIVKNNPETVEKVIKEVLKDVEGNVIYNGKDLVYKDKDGNDQTIDLDKLVKANETVTTLLAGADGTYTYKSEDGTETKIDIPASVVQNFETIVKNNPETVEKVIKEVLKDVEGNVIYNGKDLVYKDKDGNDQTIDLDKLVKANETVTTLLAGADGTYTYKSEDGTETIINIPNSVITQFETIIKDETVKNEITKLLGNSGGNVFYDGTNLEYKDANGDKKEVNLTDLIKTNETVTKLVDNNDGTFTYYNEKEIDQSGAPKPNTGLSFKVPSLDAPVLASFITSGTYTEKSYNYDTMTASSTAGIFMNTNAVQGELFRSTFKTNSNPANTKYLQVMFEVDSGITTIGGYIGNNEVYAKVEFRVLVNNKEVKRFVDKFYRYGGYNFGLNQAYDSYVGMVSLADVPNLSESNTVTITVRPASSTFHKNVGTNDGSIKAGANKAVTYKATGVVVQVFEK